MLLWSRAPGAIEADLAFRGIDIGWWHRGTLDEHGFPRLSSRRLLVLLDNLDADSSYQAVCRDGAWAPWMQMLKEIHKESALMRAARFSHADDPELNTYTVFLDPAQGRAAAAEQAEEAEFREQAETELYDALGWT